MTAAASGWNGSSWMESSGQYSDRLIAKHTLGESLDDWTGRARIYESAAASTAFDVDMLVSGINLILPENTQFAPHIGNGFSFIAFGKDLMTADVSGTVVDTHKNYGKDKLMDLYVNYMRVEAVASRGALPVMQLPNVALYFAADSLNVVESGQSDDTIRFSMHILILKACFTSASGTFVMDYTHGLDLSAESVASSTGDSSEGSDANGVSIVSSDSKGTAAAQ